MSWCGNVCDFAEDEVIEPLEDFVDHATAYANNHIVDPIDQGINEIVDELTDLGDSLWSDTQDLLGHIEEVGAAIGQKIDDAWEEVNSKAEDFVQDLWTGLNDAWTGLLRTLSEWGQWVREQVDSATDWLKTAADAVLAWFVEDFVPWLWAFVKSAWVLIKFIGALIVAGICWLVSKFTDPEEVSVMKAITDHHPRTLSEFRIHTLPAEHSYVVFSDIHLYVDGEFNYYGHNGNADVHRLVLAYYASQRFPLIENGDVEDFWMRGGGIKGTIYDVADVLPYPAYDEAYCNQAFWSAAQWHAANVFEDNAATYALVDQLFVSSGTYARTVGNHDSPWDDAEMEHMFQLVFRAPVVANDYVLLTDSNTGETDFVIAHGHQSDVWNMRMCDFAGKAVTDAACWLTEVTGGLFKQAKKFYVTRAEWESELAARGFDNEIHGMEKLGLGQSLDEAELYDAIGDEYEDHLQQPHLILGHTHNVKDDPGVPNYMYEAEWEWHEYSNSGCTGMIEGLVTCLEVSYPNVQAVAWYIQNGTLQRKPLRSYRCGDVYLQ